MQAIYEPKGAAREYAPLALNLYRGCSHGCTYCYAPSCLRMTRENFAKPEPRSGILDALKKDLQKNVPDKTVLLCFTSDPYQPIEKEFRTTRQALEIMDDVVPQVAILTKNVLVREDFEIIARNGWTVGATLTCYTEEFAKKWEPNAPVPAERIKVLEEAETAGIKTFVSIEPVLSREEFEIVLDKIRPLKIENGVRIGKWNHAAEAKEIDWVSILSRAVRYSDCGKPIYIKDELARYGQPPAEMRVRFFG